MENNLIRDSLGVRGPEETAYAWFPQISLVVTPSPFFPEHLKCHISIFIGQVIPSIYLEVIQVLKLPLS